MNLPRLSALQGLSMLGMPGCLGVVLLLVAAWFYWGEAPLVKQNLADEQDAIAHLREQLTRASASSKEAPATQAVSTNAAWQQLWQNLPVEKDGEQMQVRLLASAKQHGVQLGSVQFQGGVLTGLPAVWRQRITLPVEAPYPVLRQWINEVLQSSAAGADVSLDAIEISRTDVMSNTVKARLVWSMWWRASP